MYKIDIAYLSKYYIKKWNVHARIEIFLDFLNYIYLLNYMYSYIWVSIF